MQNKIKILHHAGQLGSLNSDWFRPFVEPVFEFAEYDPAETYSPGTLFYLKDLFIDAGQVEYYHSLGFRVVIDNLWELSLGPIEHALVLHNQAWFWYNEALWYRHRGYTEYMPQRDHQYLALMPMNLHKPHRDLLKAQLGNTLDRMIWSYVSQGRQLPNDRDMTDWDTQRYINPEWFDQTYCSVVAETLMQPAKYQSIFITEKTFKPMAFKHPFLLVGHQYTLRTLRELGFVTWDNLWDESYDLIKDWRTRLNAVVDLVKAIEIKPYDTETLQRLEHNYHRFFDFDLIGQRIRKEIITPIIEYAET